MRDLVWKTDLVQVSLKKMTLSITAIEDCSLSHCSCFANFLSNDIRTRSAFLACSIDILCGVGILFNELNDNSHAAVDKSKKFYGWNGLDDR